ncbi:PilW family protein [Aliagarivorans marinus]|uniref:PilW family protein n=1 Tax=Aliagarivorans marinus TaxID=561965 RepID=UPI00040A04CD|nr:PilW family protein [Aliagarivorans marinus]
MAKYLSQRSQAGAVLLEWIISLSIGLFIIGGITGFLAASKRTTESGFHIEQMLESGRIATELISRDLQLAGFFGEYTGNTMVRGASVNVMVADLAADDDCIIDWLGTGNEGSFPTVSGRFSALFVGTVRENNSLNGQYDCVADRSDLVMDSDVIGIKRVIGVPLADAGDMEDNRFYFAGNSVVAQIFDDTDDWPSEAAMPGRQVWEYQHIAYYLDVSQQSGLPVLRRYHLIRDDSGVGKIAIEGSGPLVEGVERIRVLLGVDTDLVVDGIVDDYLSPDEVTPQQWSENRVLAAKLFVLVRSLTEDSSYVNNNSYELGDVTVDSGGDHYRRMLFQSVVSLRNMVIHGGSS